LDLRDLLDRKFNYLDPHLAAHVIHQLAKAVAASHHAGVLHRDLKPSNIMVSDDPSITVVKITDFGIAKMTEHEFVEGMKDEDSITGSQTVLGALPYMAPEMIRDPKHAGFPADIWALGAILYRLVSGVVPFGSGLSAIPTILDAKVPGRPTMFDRKKQFAPLTDEIWDLIKLCLSKEIPSRPTADDLVELCSRLCYSDAERSEGSILNYGKGTGSWGNIRDSSGIEIFFHYDSFYGEKPTSGLKVNFASFDGQPRPRAFPVLEMK
jgi:serine/threonine-protein kinase